MKKITICHYAEDHKAGMTVVELDAFLRDVFGHQANATHSVVDGAVKIRSTWHGTIKSAQITIELEDEN